MNTFIRLKIILVIFLVSTLTVFSQSGIQKNKESAITFTIKNFGLKVAGAFHVFSVLNKINTSNLKDSFFNAEISVNSIFTDIESRDKHLLKAAYFDVKKFPKIIFVSTGIEKGTNSKYVLKGFITIKGIRKKIETPLEIKVLKKKVVYTANFVLDRKDFDVGGSSFVLSNKVNIKMLYVENKN